MSDPRAIKTIYINEETFSRGILSGTAWQGAQPLSFYRGSQSLLKAHIMMNDGITYFKPPTGSTWLAGFDDVFTVDHPDLVTSLNDQFIATDWAGADGADFDNGKVCWRMDWTSTALKTALGDKASLSGYMALWMTPPGENPVLIAQWNAIVNNITVDPTTAVNQPGVVYVQTDMLEPYLRKKEPNCPLWYNKTDGKTYMWNPDDSLWYPVGLRTLQGKVSFVIGETGVSI
jgi:hypothetical protein